MGEKLEETGTLQKNEDRKQQIYTPESLERWENAPIREQGDTHVCIQAT